MNNREHSSNNVQTNDDAEISNVVATTATNSHLTPSEANFFQAFIRMAVAVFLTLWAISQSLFDRRLAITDSAASSTSSLLEEFEDDFNFAIMEEDNKKEDKKEENERIKKKTKKRKNKREGEEKNSSSSSSSSRDSSLEREEDGKKPSLKIDSNLLHTDTMPKITTEELGKREDEMKDESEEKIATPESPPIQIETIGVRMERRQQQAFENGQQPQQLPPPPPPFFMFKPAEVEEEEEEDENQPPLFGRLDAIAEEDSDELRSASSSRASTARFHLRPSVSPEIKEELKKEEDIEGNNLPKMPFKFLFERQQSAGGSSQSSVAKVVELDNSEDEEDKEKISPKVPRLDLEGVSLENSEAEEDTEQTARDGITPISDTDTIIINEEEGEEKNKKVTFEDEKEKIFETKKALEVEDEVKREEEKKMYSTAAMLFQHPSDADRDQGELFASLADQHIPMPPPMEDGRLSSPSMSINLDRSRESLDHSICSIPTKETENISQEFFSSLPSPILSSSTLVGLTNGGTKNISERDFDSSQRNGANGMLTTGIGDIMSKKQSEKASSTSSSSPAYIQKTYIEEEEEPMPLPPPPPSTTTSNGLTTKLTTTNLPLNGSSFPVSLRQEPPPPPPLPTLPPVSSPESVLPLWGRNERLTSYLHGYGATLPKNFETEKESIERRKRQEGAAVEGEGKENGIINNYVPPPSYRWIESERKKMEERQKEEDRAWTIHPIALKERPSSRSTQEDKRRPTANGERNIPIKIHPDTYKPFSASNDWFHSPFYDSLWPQRSGFGGFQQSMSSSELPPLPPLYSLPPLQQPPSLYGGSSAKPSPVPTAFASVGAFDHSFESSSRSDFMSASGGPASTDQRAGRQTTNIREIPIQRSASAFAPSIGGIMGSGARPIQAAAPPPTHNEYYRREVLTRTLVTRSTEALSAPPPLSRSPPVAPTLPPTRPLNVDLPPRDQLSEEYWVRYSRNIEEEERRLRSEQEHRRRAEEERRLRVEEQRRRLEQQEQELVEKLRREREQLGKTLEAQMLDRERAERDRIHQDRLEREAAERRRREVEIIPFGNFWYWNEEEEVIDEESFEAVNEEENNRYFLLDIL